MMYTQRSTNVVAALVAAGFLLIVAWGGAHGLFVASLLALVTGASGVWLRRRDVRPYDARAMALAALVGFLVAAVIAVVVARLYHA